MATERGGSVSQRYMAYDGNGNVVALIDAQTGNALDRFRYDPFGNELESSNHRSIRNAFRFSTKYHDEETGFLYYGFRYYQPSAGRWLSRDPINERGFKVLTRSRTRSNQNEGKNLYVFVTNDPLRLYDPLGTSLIGGPSDVFPDSWAISGDNSPYGKAGGWYAVHCASHCYARSLNRLLNCPVEHEWRYDLIWTVSWEIFEAVADAAGVQELHEPWYDHLTDVVANSYGTALGASCGGPCGRCGFDILDKAEKARDCCDKGCAGGQPFFMLVAHMFQSMTGEPWEE